MIVFIWVGHTGSQRAGNASWPNPGPGIRGEGGGACEREGEGCVIERG